MELSNVKTSFICRNILPGSIVDDPSFIQNYVPTAGEVGIFKVVHIGKHKRLQNAEGINQHIMQDDRIMCAFGNRYASAQFEGYVPKQAQEYYDLLGQGGVVGLVQSMHSNFLTVGTTKLVLEGIVLDDRGNILNTHQILPSKDVAIKEVLPHTKLVLSIGCSMDSGKTTTAAYTIRGLSRAGYKVSFIKLTGTAYSKDAQLAQDMGACPSLDFSHFGFPSTYMYPVPLLVQLFKALLLQMTEHNPDFVVVEIADGILQQETKGLICHPEFMQMIDHVILSGVDSLGLFGALQILAQYSVAPTMLAGRATASPLLVQEICNLCQLPVLGLDKLQNPDLIQQVLNTSSNDKHIPKTRLAA